jgi:hypothetical protein
MLVREYVDLKLRIANAPTVSQNIGRLQRARRLLRDRILLFVEALIPDARNAIIVDVFLLSGIE